MTAQITSHTITLKGIEDAVREWLVAAVDAEVIFAHRDDPFPDMPYLYVEIGLVRNPGVRDWTGPLSPEGVQHTYGQRIRTVQVVGKGGPEASDLVQTAHASVWTNTVHNILTGAGLAVQGCSQINEAPALEETSHIRMTYFDVELMYQSDLEETVPVAKEVVITTDYVPAEGADPTITTEQTISLEEE